MPTTNLTLEVHPGTDVLDRVVCICRRRNLRILALIYTEQQITLAVAGDERQTRSIDRWLSSLVDVLNVKRRGRGGALEDSRDRGVATVALAAR